MAVFGTNTPAANSHTYPRAGPASGARNFVELVKEMHRQSAAWRAWGGQFWLCGSVKHASLRHSSSRFPVSFEVELPRPKSSAQPIRDPIQRKIARLKKGGRPRVLDLFAGCGGISLGFQKSGAEISAAVEFDPIAARSHAINFHSECEPQLFEAHALARDITSEEPEALCESLSLGSADSAFDILVGGPPCQAYARVGRAKLRDVAAHPRAFKVDPRANLYLRYLHYVEKTKPLALLMENVPDIMNFGGHNIVEEIAEVLDELGYTAGYSIANAAFYGVPQFRDRVFLVAYWKGLKIRPSFPAPERWIDLPAGYNGTRAVAFKNLDMFSGGAFLPEIIPGEDLPPAITTGEAIGDLPPITLHLEGKLKRGARRFTETISYDARRKVSDYVRALRSWPGFENSVGVADHVIRSLPRDTEIFRHMEQGDEYPAAHATATRLFEMEINRRIAQGEKLNSAAREELRKVMVPPYPIHNFPNRWWKLRKNRPSRTLLAHIGKDTYSHIHYDDSQARTISVREAARLQSFPDGFQFAGTMNPAFRQIGNAVPPLLAASFAELMLAELRAQVGRANKIAA